MFLSIETLDRVFGVLLLVGSVLHSYGSISSYPRRSEQLVWALSGSLACGLIAVLNLVRSGRPDDITLAWITFVACLCWCAVAVGYGTAIARPRDPRVLWHGISALALAAFSLRTALGYAG
jgi:hypothetical protein